MKLCPSSNKRPRLTQGAYFRSHARSWLTSLTIILFTCVSPRTKVRCSQSVVPYSIKIYAFYMCSTAYKKQGALDQWSLTQQKLMLFTRIAPRTKNKGLSIGGPLLSKNLYFLHVYHRVQKAKGLPINALHIFYYFQHALRRVQKARGSICMCSKFIILLIKFSKVIDGLALP
jgi:hypothetical protein